MQNTTEFLTIDHDDLRRATGGTDNKPKPEPEPDAGSQWYADQKKGWGDAHKRQQAAGEAFRKGDLGGFAKNWGAGMINTLDTVKKAISPVTDLLP